MTKRNVIGRYRGSLFGLLWSFFNPIIMLSVYTFAFSFVFQAKWGMENENHFDFALILFASLTIFNLFAELVRDAPNLIVSQPNFVKKVVFPIEILPIVSMLSTLFHAIISLGIFIIFYAIVHLTLHWTLILLPFVLIPLLLISLGIGYFLASFGVFVRDTGQIISHLVMILLFTSPVFFSLERIPVQFRGLMMINPVAYLLENARKVMVFGQLPDWILLGSYTVIGFFSLYAGFWWFQKTRKGFADVL